MRRYTLHYRYTTVLTPNVNVFYIAKVLRVAACCFRMSYVRVCVFVAAPGTRHQAPGTRHQAHDLEKKAHLGAGQHTAHAHTRAHTRPPAASTSTAHAACHRPPGCVKPPAPSTAPAPPPGSPPQHGRGGTAGAGRAAGPGPCPCAVRRAAAHLSPGVPPVLWRRAPVARDRGCVLRRGRPCVYVVAGAHTRAHDTPINQTL
jgi:hypothetical protein